MRLRTWLGFLAPVAALGAAVAPLAPRTVERWFSAGVYLRLQPVVTGASNRVPVALFDALAVGVGALAVWWLVVAPLRARPGRRLRVWLASVGKAAVAAAVLYLWFLALWGLNYRRVPMTERLEVRPGPAPAGQVEALARQAVAMVNATHGPAHAQGWGVEPWRNAALRRAFAQTQRLLVDGPPAEPGRLKPTLFGPYFRWTGVDGMVAPFALEVLANPDLLPFERPFVAAHEWAHLAGFADESEANFVGWLTCVRGDAPARYSGWLFLYWQLAGDVRPSVARELAAALEPGPKRDVAAISERLRRGQLPTLRRASWAVYDEYLKANHVEAGVRSYGLVVTLLVQTRFRGDWEPVRRTARNE